MHPCDVFTYILQGCFTGAEAMIAPVLVKYMKRQMTWVKSNYPTPQLGCNSLHIS